MKPPSRIRLTNRVDGLEITTLWRKGETLDQPMARAIKQVFGATAHASGRYRVVLSDKTMAVIEREVQGKTPLGTIQTTLYAKDGGLTRWIAGVRA